MSRLPLRSVRDRIASCVDRAIVETLDPAVVPLSCLHYAYAAAIVGAIATKRAEPYDVMVGSLSVLTATGDQTEDGKPWYLAYDATDRQTRGLEFHAWAAGPGPEVIDLSARHYRHRAEQSGIPWLVPEYGPYIWSYGALPEGVRMNADMDATSSARSTFLAQEDRVIKKITHRAFDLYGQKAHR